MERPEIFRALAMAMLIALFIAALAALNQRPMPVASDLASDPTHTDLSSELRRCSALGPQDAEDPHCRTVWEQNRQHFFGGPTKPSRVEAAPNEPAQVPPSAPEVTSGGGR